MNPLWIKIGLWAVGLSVLAGIIFMVNGWRTTARDLTAWQAVVIEGVSAATVPSGKLLKPDQISGAIRALATDRDDARRSLSNIDTETRALMARADAADKRLSEQQKDWDRRAAASAATIAALKAARSTGNADQDAAMVETASQAAWKGWR